jgi:signal transduction histidine kinase
MIPSDLSAERQIEDLSSRLKEAEAACAAKDSFIAAISRELNNPLAPVLMAVEHLRALLPGGDAGRLEAAMQMLERATGGFARRTRVLLDFADLTAGAAPLQTTAVAISTLVAAAAGQEVAEMARLARCTLELDVAPGLVAVANADALTQVLGHILANAFRFGAGRPVRVSARQDSPDAVLITITDEGPGIDAAKAAGLFALFHKTRPPLEPGLGIGLWVCAQLVAGMGGTIGVQTDQGRGAIFHVRLPAPQARSVAPHAQTLQTHREPGVS